MLVLFGHQSVGQNILDGLGDLAQDGVPTPTVTTLQDASTAGSRLVLAHFRVGTNGQPLTKIQDFERVVASDAGKHAHAAMFKFCYVDLQDSKQAPPLFDAYAQMIERLRDLRPDLALAHVTMPLRAVPTGLTVIARRLLGQRHPQLAANAARHAFNELMRARYGSGSLVFDLAAVESGERRAAPALVNSYTDDGGHLNEVGRRVVAQQFLKLLDRLAAGRAAPSG